MSWLSKALGGNTLKIGAVVLGSMVGKEYLFGKTSYDEFGDAKYSPDSFIGSGFNTLGIKPFGETAIGKLASPYMESAKGLLDFGTTLAGGQERSLQFGDLPSVSGVTNQPLRTDTRFQAGRASMIPLGNNGRVSSALANPNIQSYLAKRAKMVALPSVNTATPTLSSSGASLASTTSSRRRARAKLVG
jgi:hypothetical protein